MSPNQCPIVEQENGYVFSSAEMDLARRQRELGYIEERRYRLSRRVLLQVVGGTVFATSAIIGQVHLYSNDVNQEQSLNYPRDGAVSVGFLLATWKRGKNMRKDVKQIGYLATDAESITNGSFPGPYVPEHLRTIEDYDDVANASLPRPQTLRDVILGNE